MDYIPKDPTPEQKDKIFQQMKNTMLISLAMYVALSMFFPFEVSLGVFLHMAIGEFKIRQALGKTGATIDQMGHTFKQCLKMQAMTMVWPMTVHVLEKRIAINADENKNNEKID